MRFTSAILLAFFAFGFAVAQEPLEPKQSETSPKTEPKSLELPRPVYRVAEVDGPPSQPLIETLPAEEPPYVSLFSLSADYLNWRIRRVPISVPLVGGLVGGQSLGPTDLNASAFTGLRLNSQTWFDAERRFGLGGSGTIFEQRTAYVERISDTAGSPQFDRPFISALDGASISVPISIPGRLNGRFEVSSATRFSAGDVGLLMGLSESPSGSFRLEGSVGYRYQDFREQLTVRQLGTTIAPETGNLVFDFGNLGQLGSGGGFQISDQIRTLNQFHGAQLGLRAHYTDRAVFVTVGVKTAYGTNRQSVDASGSTVLFPGPAASVVVDDAGNPTTTILGGGRGGLQDPSGLFVGPSNRGVSARNLGSFLAEADLQVGLRLSDRLSFRIGYTGLYWTGVARPGQQLQSVIDPTQLRIHSRFNATGTRLGQPAIPFASSNFFAHGWSIGAEYAF